MTQVLIPASMDPPDNQRQTDVWLITFSDLVLLLLTFMVLIFAMSTPDLRRFEQLATGAKAAFGIGIIEVEAPETATFSAPLVNRPKASDLTFLASLLESSLSEFSEDGRIDVRRTEEYLVVSLPGDLAFEDGQASLSDDARRALFDMTAVLNNLDNQIAIAGHTDPIPLGDAPFLTNWELSLARAAQVANALTEAGYQKEVIIFGRADSDFARLGQAFPELDLSDRYAAARRVDIIILPNISGT